MEVKHVHLSVTSELSKLNVSCPNNELKFSGLICKQPSGTKSP